MRCELWLCAAFSRAQGTSGRPAGDAHMCLCSQSTQWALSQPVTAVCECESESLGNAPGEQAAARKKRHLPRLCARRWCCGSSANWPRPPAHWLRTQQTWKETPKGNKSAPNAGFFYFELSSGRKTVLAEKRCRPCETLHLKTKAAGCGNAWQSTLSHTRPLTRCFVSPRWRCSRLGASGRTLRELSKRSQREVRSRNRSRSKRSQPKSAAATSWYRAIGV